MRILLLLLSWVGISLIAACAVPVPRYAVAPVEREQLRSFQMEGRFSLRQEAQSYTGKLSWRHGPEGDDIFLMNPFGQGAAEINRRPGAARLLTASQQEYVAADADQLVAEVLGYALPVSGMAEWLLGRSRGAGQARKDAAGRLSRLEEEGWVIDYDYGDSADPQALPLRLTARRGETLELKLRIDDWSAQ